MKSKEAREHIKDIFEGGLDQCHAEELESLILWAYDKGWTEALEDYKQEQDILRGKK